MHSASWTRTRIEAALALTTTADEPRVAVTSSRAPNRTLCGWTATAATLLRVRYGCALIFTGQLPHLFWRLTDGPRSAAMRVPTRSHAGQHDELLEPRLLSDAVADDL